MIIVSIQFALHPGSTKEPKKQLLFEKSEGKGEFQGGIIKQKAKDRDILPSTDNDTEDKPANKTKSMQVASLPWEEDVDFQRALEENKIDVLMAAYRTVLEDPLPGEEFNVHLAAGLLSGKVVAAGEVFSQNREIGPYDKSRGFREGPTYAGSKLIITVGGGVCKISSTLYNVAVLSNLEIVQRHNHGMPVPYVPYGQDATVAYGSRDFQFKNNTSYPILIWAKGIDNVLYIGFYGKEKSPKVQWYHETKDVEEAPTIYKRNPDLPKKTENILVEGMDGATIESRVTITYQDGTMEIKNMGTSHYKPMPHIIEISD